MIADGFTASAEHLSAPSDVIPLEFTTLIGDRSVVDIYLLNVDCTSPIGAVCWKDIGTTSEGSPLASVNPPDGYPSEENFDLAWVSECASHGEWLIPQPGAYEVYSWIDEYQPGETSGENATFRLVAVPETSGSAWRPKDREGECYEAQARPAALRVQRGLIRAWPRLL
jgi:hypothetical protein